MGKTTKGKPLDQLDGLLHRIDCDELLEFTRRVHFELARRARNFADVVDEDDAPLRDVIFEGIAFCAVAGDLLPSLLAPGETGEPWRQLTEAEDRLKSWV